MAHDRSAPPEEVIALMRSVTPNEDIILGCDANARHTIWGSSEINDRGMYMFDFINFYNMSICNSGSKPTFIFPSSENFIGWEEVLDITLINDKAKLSVNKWRVSDKRSFSDHNWILFEIGLQLDTKTCFRNPKRTDWSKFNSILKHKLRIMPEVEDTTSGLDKVEKILSSAITKAFEISCPQTKAKRSYPPWWNKELSRLRKESRRAFNTAYRDKEWQPYRDKLNAYKKAIKIAKRNSWRNFCESIENTRDSARLSKVLARGHSNPLYVKRLDDSWSESSSESLDILLDTHFPGCKDVAVDEVAHRGSTSEIDVNIISHDRILWAIDTFSAYKSPGPDGIVPQMLQSAKDSIIPWLHRIFTLSLSLNHVPLGWRKVKVIFIPKNGKRSHENAKDFRPISLSSFLLKTLERLIDTHIRQKLESSSLLSRNQHAYLKGRSTETALHAVVGTIERSLEFKQYTLAAFLDIEGAFNNVTTSAIQRALEDLDVERYISNWIVNMLKSRVITACLGNSEKSKQVERGTPQGGVISPLLWLIVVNSILVKLEVRGIKAVAYADDVVLLVSGMFLDVISNIMTNALDLLSNWAKGNGLGVNPSKTELVLFTTKTKIPSFRLPRLLGCELPLSKNAKYLGIILDSKLSWKLNVEHRVKKATVAYYTCRKMFSAKWGLSPLLTRWMYTAIIRPILTYGSLVWWTATKRKYVVDQLYRVQRSACIGITGALRTSPSEALNTILHLTPIDIHLMAISTSSAMRLSASDCWRSRTYGHAKILNLLPNSIHQKSDYTTPLIDFDRRFKITIPSRREWKRGHLIDEYDIRVYTDGSKMECGVGSGVFCDELSLRLSIRLPDKASVFQAEILAIKEACRILCEKNIRGSTAIFVDSQAALMSLQSHTTTSILVRQCKEELSRLGRLTDITLVWVPAHRDYYGNEKADELAKEGSALDISTGVSVATPLGTIKSEIFRHYFQKAGNRWRNLDTCRTTRNMWPAYNEKRSFQLLNMKRKDISRIIAVLTGHWTIGKHASRLGLPFNNHCRSCHDREKEETVFHLLCECPALQNYRLKFFNNYILNNLTETSGIRWCDFIGYLNATGWI